MNKRCFLLAGMLAVSGTLMGVIGLVVKFAVLEPLGVYQDKNAVALPFVLMRDEGLQYMLSNPEPTVVTEPVAPTQTEQSPTVSETTPPAAAEPPSTEPQNNILDRVLFIGDSRTCGLRDHARIEGADYFCDVGMSVFNFGKKRLTDECFSKKPLKELLAGEEYTCVTVNLGLNESGYPIESLMAAYQDLVNQIVQTQPQAVIVLQGILTVGRDWAKAAPYAAPKNLSAINQRISALADGYRIFYIDANEVFSDSEGFLPESMTWDGCHLYAKDTDLWSRWFCDAVLEINR